MSPHTAHRTELEDEAVHLSSDQSIEAEGAGDTAIVLEDSITASWCMVHGRQTFQTTFFLSQLPEHVDMILGRDWSEKHDYIKYKKSILVLHIKEKKGLYS